MSKELILVNEVDQEIGYGEKLSVHQNAQLHRAFSIFVVNDQDQLMLQKRAYSKYHSGGLWTNTCCSHPLKGEEQDQTVHNRLLDEMGFDCELTKLFHFIYKAELDKGLTEHELDYVYFGRYNHEPKLNPEEACDWKWMDLDELRTDLLQNPDQYTFWINDAFERFYQIYIDNYRIGPIRKQA